MIHILTIRDYSGTEYPLLAVKKHKSELNGTDDLQLTVHQQKNNSLDLKQIDKLWEIEYENVDYKIIHIKRQTRGNSFYLEVRAKPLFYWDFEKSIIHENHDGSHTANSAFRTVFENSEYNFVLVDFSPSVEIEGFGKGSNRLELFKRLLDRYNYEFEIQGKTVYMRHLIGNDTNFMYKYKLNASNISENIDADGMFTHIKGFGNFEDGEEDYFNNAQLKREYTSPLADIIGNYEGPPIVDGRVTQQSTLDEAMKKAVDDSLQISVEGTLHDIRQMGYDIAVPLKGDRIWLMDERIDLEQEIRVYSVETAYDEKDNIIDCQVTFGSQSIRERHKAAINTLSQNFRDLLEGKLKLPVISLEKIGMDMINAIHAASSEIIFGDFGMQAISKTNPNHVFGLNSEGWYISQDGGRTPRTIATAQGIYADAIFAGTLWLTNDLNIESVDGYLNVTGSRFIMRSKHNSNAYVEITPDGLIISEGFINIYGKDGRELLIDGYMRGAQIANVQQFNNETYVRFNGRDMEITEDDEYYRIYVLWDEYRGRYLNIGGTVRLSDDSASTWRYIDVKITELGAGDVATKTLQAYRTWDSSETGWSMRIDLQDYYGSVPNYRKIRFYVEVRARNLFESNVVRFRMNTGEFNG